MATTFRALGLAGVVAFGVVSVSACTSTTGDGGSGTIFEQSSVESADSAQQAMAYEDGAAFDLSGQAGDQVWVGPVIVVTGDATVTSPDPISAADDFADYVLEMGGRIDSRSTSDPLDEPSASVSARVPSDKFEEVRKGLAEFGSVSSSSIYSEDVTQQSQDLNARVEALEKSISRLQELMDQATTVEELIAAENSLTQRQAELDSLRTQLDWLEDQVQMSSLWVSFVTPKSAPGFSFGKAWQMFLTSIQVVGYVILVALPWLVLAGIVAGAIIWGRRRNRLRNPDRLQPSGVSKDNPDERESVSSPKEDRGASI